MASSGAEIVLIVLQSFVVAFLWIHDWIPLGRLNDVSAPRSQDTLKRLIFITFIQSIPWSIGLFYSWKYFGRPYPHWLQMWLWISYLVLVIGVIRAWRVPYFLGADARRIDRYRVMFGKTHSFLPKRNGMVPNSATFCFLLPESRHCWFFFDGISGHERLRLK